MERGHSFLVPHELAILPTKSKGKTNPDLTLALALSQARISGWYDDQPYGIWGFLGHVLGPTLSFLLPERLPPNFLVTGNSSHSFP